MGWIVSQVDNVRKEFKIKRHTGQIIKIAVPKEHQSEVTSRAYVRAVQDAHEMVLGAPKRLPTIKALGLIASAISAIIWPALGILVASALILSELHNLYTLVKSR